MSSLATVVAPRAVRRAPNPPLETRHDTPRGVRIARRGEALDLVAMDPDGEHRSPPRAADEASRGPRARVLPGGRCDRRASSRRSPRRSPREPRRATAASSASSARIFDANPKRPNARVAAARSSPAPPRAATAPAAARSAASTPTPRVRTATIRDLAHPSAPFSSDDAKDALAAVAVTYAFAAWRWLQWPAAAPTAALVPAPHVAAAVALGATARRRSKRRSPRTPKQRRRSMAAPRAPRSAFEARARSPPREASCSPRSPPRISSRARRLGPRPPRDFDARRERRRRGVATSSAACYAVRLACNRARAAGSARAAIVLGGASFVVVTALLAAKHNMFHGGVVQAAAAAAPRRRPTTGARGARTRVGHRVGAGRRVGVDVRRRARHRRRGDGRGGLRRDQVRQSARDSPHNRGEIRRRSRSRRHAAFASIAMNPNAVAALTSIGVEPRAILLLFIALAAPRRDGYVGARRRCASPTRTSRCSPRSRCSSTRDSPRATDPPSPRALSAAYSPPQPRWWRPPCPSRSQTISSCASETSTRTRWTWSDDSRGEIFAHGWFQPSRSQMPSPAPPCPWDFAATAARRANGPRHGRRRLYRRAEVAWLMDNAGFKASLVSSALYLLFNKLACRLSRRVRRRRRRWNDVGASHRRRRNGDVRWRSGAALGDVVRAPRAHAEHDAVRARRQLRDDGRDRGAPARSCRRAPTTRRRRRRRRLEVHGSKPAASDFSKCSERPAVPRPSARRGRGPRRRSGRVAPRGAAMLAASDARAKLGRC